MMTDDKLLNTLKTAGNIAVIGASPEPMRSSNSIARRVMDLGREIYPVNPNYREVLGRRCVETMQQLPDNLRIDIALIFRNSAEAPESVRDIISFARNRSQNPVVWTQPGAHSETARELAENAGLEYMGDFCIAVEYARLKAD